MRAILDFFLPPRCRLCDVRTDGEPIPWVCQQCWLAIEYVGAPTCYQCGQPFDAPPEGIASPMHRCGACLLQPPPYERARSVGMYRGVLRDVIHAMKYQRVYGLVQPLADLLSAQFAYHWGRDGCIPDALVPIPLHRRRLREREFDQALALAVSLSRDTGIPLWADVLVRERPTISQVGLNAEQRRRNVRGAFTLRDPQRCRNKTLLVIDDVYTTGATVRECARLLQGANAAQVNVYTLARVG